MAQESESDGNKAGPPRQRKMTAKKSSSKDLMVDMDSASLAAALQESGELSEVAPKKKDDLWKAAEGRGTGYTFLEKIHMVEFFKQIKAEQGPIGAEAKVIAKFGKPGRGKMKAMEVKYDEELWYKLSEEDKHRKELPIEWKQVLSGTKPMNWRGAWPELQECKETYWNI